MLETDSIVRDFLVESYENLDQLDRDLVALEKDPSAKDRLASIFRTIHTIKGTCGFFGFSQLEGLTHRGENLLSKLRDGKLELNQDITTALLSMIDGVRKILAVIEETGEEGQHDYAALMEELSRLCEGKPKEADPPAPSSKEAAAPAPKPAAPADPEPPPPPNVGDILINQGRATQEDIDRAVAEQKEGDPRHLGEILVDQGVIKPKDVVDALQIQNEAKSAAAVSDSTIRVDVGLLDKLMNLVGELVLARNQILQFTSSQKDSSFVATSQRLNLITTELQEGVMKTRMQPIGNIWSKFPRVVRDLSVSCGKKVRIEMEGKDTEIDKTIIEAIKDPLTHLVRNSVDHGIQSPAERRALGKPEEGRLFLRAFHEGGQVNIEISDDGGGIDPEKIRAKALQKGVITADQAARMSEHELINLVFLPGFSTAEKVTNVSGRGVGMDVVKTNIEKIGGTIDIQSKHHEGTSVKIKIPLTLAIIPALVVTVGKDRYAIPQVSLLELVRLEGEQARKGVETIQGTPVHRLRGHLLPLVYLQRELQLNDTGNNGNDVVNIVVLQADDRQFGLVVGGVSDTEEIVVKPLSKLLKGIPAFAGATIMGDGQVALILDVMGLAQKANVISAVRDRALAESVQEVQGAAEDQQTLLLFEAGKNYRMAIPLGLVARLEEFPATSLEISGDQQVVQYRNQILPLIRLSEVFGTTPDETLSKDLVQVVVYTDKTTQRSVGLVVDRILDIVEEHVKVKRQTHREGILGSAVIQSRVVQMLDLQGIVRVAEPTFYEEPAGAAVEA